MPRALLPSPQAGRVPVAGGTVEPAAGRCRHLLLMLLGEHAARCSRGVQHLQRSAQHALIPRRVGQGHGGAALVLGPACGRMNEWSRHEGQRKGIEALRLREDGLKA